MDVDHGSWTEEGRLVGFGAPVVLVVSPNVVPNHQKGAASNSSLLLLRNPSETID